MESSQDYFQKVRAAIVVHDIDLLVQLWRQAMYALPEAAVVIVQTMINLALPELAKYHQIPITEETTFPEFIDLYDEKHISKLIAEEGEDLINYLRKSVPARALKISKYFYNNNLSDLLLQGRVYYWLLLKLVDKPERKEVKLPKNIISPDIYQGLLQEADREGNYEPVDFLCKAMAGWLLGCTQSTPINSGRFLSRD